MFIKTGCIQKELLDASTLGMQMCAGTAVDEHLRAENAQERLVPERVIQLHNPGRKPSIPWDA